MMEDNLEIIIIIIIIIWYISILIMYKTVQELLLPQDCTNSFKPFSEWYWAFPSFASREGLMFLPEKSQKWPQLLTSSK
jgi:hypothetical protein